MLLDQLAGILETHKVGGVTTIIESDDAEVIVVNNEMFLPLVPYEQQRFVQFTHVLSLATGSQIITGVGFKPRLILFQNGIVGGSGYASIGQANEAHFAGSPDTYIEFGLQPVLSLFYYQPGGVSGIQRDDNTSNNYAWYQVTSFDDDGFTLLWTKFGTPVATVS